MGYDLPVTHPHQIDIMSFSRIKILNVMRGKKSHLSVEVIEDTGEQTLCVELEG